MHIEQARDATKSIWPGYTQRFFIALMCTVQMFLIHY